MKSIFKEGDKVYHIQYGWGIVTKVFDHEGDIIVQSKFTFGDKTISFAIRNKLQNLLSFTEYTLEGFSEERPEDLPNRGDIVWVRNNPNQMWHPSHFMKKEDDKYFASINCNWYNTETYYEMTTINPYIKNEQ